MNTAERSALPPPADCLTCDHIETWRIEGRERSTCLRGHPMHPGCGWYREKTPAAVGQEPSGGR